LRRTVLLLSQEPGEDLAPAPHTPVGQILFCPRHLVGDAAGQRCDRDWLTGLQVAPVKKVSSELVFTVTYAERVHKLEYPSGAGFLIRATCV